MVCPSSPAQLIPEVLCFIGATESISLHVSGRGIFVVYSFKRFVTLGSATWCVSVSIVLARAIIDAYVYIFVSAVLATFILQVISVAMASEIAETLHVSVVLGLQFHLCRHGRIHIYLHLHPKNKNTFNNNDTTTAV